MSEVSNHCHPNEGEFEKICGKEGEEMRKTDRELNKFWKCDCGVKLPRKGFVWRSRYNDFLSRNRFSVIIVCGYYCDDCADRRESVSEY